MKSYDQLVAATGARGSEWWAKNSEVVIRGAAGRREAYIAVESRFAWGRKLTICVYPSAPPEALELQKKTSPSGKEAKKRNTRQRS